jgi:uridine phosphorylase
VSIHIHPVAELAPRVLLPGDPGRAMAMAQTLLADGRLMFNHNRGLWGYSGIAADGDPLTIQATGVGGPSAAIVLEELADLGARQVIRVGTCGAIAPGLGLGELVAADAVLPADGTSRALGLTDLTRLDEQLTAVLSKSADHTAPVVSADLFYDPDFDANCEAWREQGAVAVEMEAAALAAVAARRGLDFACILIVTDTYWPHRRIAADTVEKAVQRLGESAVAAYLER